MRTVPWNRFACISELRDRIWRYLSPASTPEEQLLEAGALLQMRHEDIAALGTVHFLLGDAVGRLVKDLPLLVRRMATTSVSEEEWSAERVRGAIQWAKTHGARAATAVSHLYVTAPAHRAYQTPENELLAFIVDAIVGASRKSGWYGREMGVAGGHVHERVSAVEKWQQSRSLLEVERRPVTPRSVRRVSSGRHGRRYRSVVGAYEAFRSMVARSDPATVREAVERQALVATDDSVLFELLCTFKLVDALHGRGWDMSPFSLIGGSLQLSGARGKNERLDVWYQQVPRELKTGSRYREILKAHGFSHAAPLRPDIVVRLSRGKASRWVVVEAKLGVVRSAEASARAALVDLLAYRRAFDHVLEANPVPYGLGVAWGEGLSPRGSEVMLCSPDRLEEAVVAVF